MIERTIERTTAPTRADFQRRFERPRVPAVIEGAMENWPALSRWSLDAFAREHGEMRVRVRVSRAGERQLFAGDPSRAFRFEQRSLADCIAAMKGNDERLYVQHCELSSFTAFASDVRDPPWPRRLLRAPTQLWLAGPSTVNPLHWDFNHVLMAQVVGEKRYVLFAPKDSPRIASWVDREIWRTTALDITAPDRARFPNLDTATAFTCVLKPGEMLFIPYRYWHAVIHEAPSLSVAWWWEPNVFTHLRDMLRERALTAPKRLLRWGGDT